MHHITQHHTNLHIALSVTWNTNKYSPKLYIKIQYISVARKRIETRLHSVWRIFGRKEGLLRLDGKRGGGCTSGKTTKCQKLSTVEGCLVVKCAFFPCMEMIIVCAGGINIITVIYARRVFSWVSTESMITWWQPCAVNMKIQLLAGYWRRRRERSERFQCILTSLAACLCFVSIVWKKGTAVSWCKWVQSFYITIHVLYLQTVVLSQHFTVQTNQQREHIVRVGGGGSSSTSISQKSES